MRIERVEPSKHKKNRILVFLEGGQLLKITENELLHHDLRPGADLSEETVEELQKSAQPSQMKARGAQLTGSRMLSKKQVVEHLTRRGGDREAAEETVDEALLRKLSAALQRRGFSWQDIQAPLRRLESEIQE